MKKIISLALVVLMAVSVLAFSACDNKTTDNEPSTGDVAGNTETTTVAGSTTDATTEDLKFGLGVVSVYDTPAETGLKVTTTAVAVLLDSEGKIVDIALDVLDAKTTWTEDGVAQAATEMKTKYELGTDYGMAAYANTKEWNEQADAFVATAKGKTVAEVKALMGEDKKGTGDLATAGCTIKVDEFISALDKAVANAAASKATAANTLQIAFATSVKNVDATEEADGKVEVNATIVAAVTDAEGKVVVAKTDVAQNTVTFNAEGALTTDTTKELKTKGELGTDYGMAAYANTKEWDEQAAAFDSILVGKKAADFAALAGADNKGTGDLATAGCTIDVADMIKAATKAATVA